MEYIEGLTIKELIDLQNSKILSPQICSFISQIVNALNHLRNKGAAHRDLIAENIKFTMSCWLKLLDFGQTKAQLNSSIIYKLLNNGKKLC